MFHRFQETDGLNHLVFGKFTTKMHWCWSGQFWILWRFGKFIFYHFAVCEKFYCERRTSENSASNHGSHAVSLLKYKWDIFVILMGKKVLIRLIPLIHFYMVRRLKEAGKAGVGVLPKQWRGRNRNIRMLQLQSSLFMYFRSIEILPLYVMGTAMECKYI